VVVLLRYRFLWFTPYSLASFRKADENLERRAVEVLSWKGHLNRKLEMPV
jgi:hypothetical protein